MRKLTNKNEVLEEYMSITLDKDDEDVELIGYRVRELARLSGYKYHLRVGQKEAVLAAERDLAEIVREHRGGAWGGEPEAEWVERKLKEALSDEARERLQGINPEQPLEPLVNAIISGDVRISAEGDVPGRLEDYPEDVRREAEKIVRAAKNGEIDLFEWFLDVLDEIHVGDRREKAIALLSIGTLFVENADPVHQAVKGQRGSGKTHMILSATKVVPERFVHTIRSSSPLYLFYASSEEERGREQAPGRMKCRDDYNIYVFDDVKMNEHVVDIARFLTDNQLETKIHRTVIDQKPREFVIPGEGLVFFTRAQEITDAELNDRLLYNNPQETPKHRQRQLKFVKEQVRRGTKGSVERKLQIARAVFEHLIKDGPIKVLNPWLSQLGIEDYEDTGPREVERLINLVKGVTFYRQFQRKPIYRWDVILGTRKDLETTLRLFKAVDFLQRYQLDKSQVRLLEMLARPEEAEAWDAAPEGTQSALTDENAPTYRRLAEKFNVSAETVRRWVQGAWRATQPSLADRGLVEVRRSDPEVPNSPSLIYLTEKGARLLENAKREGVLLGFKFEDREWTDKEKEEIITDAIMLADDRIPNARIKEIIEKAKKTKAWGKAKDDKTLYKLMKSLDPDYAKARLEIMRKTRGPTTAEIAQEVQEEIKELIKKKEAKGEKTKDRIELTDYKPKTIIRVLKEIEKLKRSPKKAKVAPKKKGKQKGLADFHPNALAAEIKPKLKAPVILKTKTEEKVYDFIRERSRENEKECGYYGCLDVEVEEDLDIKPKLARKVINRLQSRGVIVNRGGWLQVREKLSAEEVGKRQAEKEREGEREEEPPTEEKPPTEEPSTEARGERLTADQREEEGEGLAGVSELARQVYEYIKEHNEHRSDTERYLGCHRFKISEAFDVSEKELDEALNELEERDLIVRHLEFFALKELEPAFWSWSL